MQRSTGRSAIKGMILITQEADERMEEPDGFTARPRAAFSTTALHQVKCKLSASVVANFISPEKPRLKREAIIDLFHPTTSDFWHSS